MGCIDVLLSVADLKAAAQTASLSPPRIYTALFNGLQPFSFLPLSHESNCKFEGGVGIDPAAPPAPESSSNVTFLCINPFLVERISMLVLGKMFTFQKCLHSYQAFVYSVCQGASIMLPLKLNLLKRKCV